MILYNTVVSYYKDVYDISGDSFEHKNIGRVGDMFNCIQVGGKDGMIKDKVLRLRQTSEKKDKDAIKRSLPVITWQGIFKKRSNDGLVALSSLVCIDIDHRTQGELDMIARQLATWCFVLAFFRSPSGDGLKVIIKTNLQEPVYYKNCYRQLEKVFTNAFGIEPDNNCEPLSQGCFLSYDPGIYVNTAAQDWQFHYDSTFDKEPCKQWYGPPVIHAVANNGDLFVNKLNTQRNNMSDEQILRILDLKFRRYNQNYQDGHRTKSIFTQASKFCKAGIEQHYAVDYLKSAFCPTGYDEGKLVYEVCQAYKKCIKQFGTERGLYKPYKNYKNEHEM